MASSRKQRRRDYYGYCRGPGYYGGAPFYRGAYGGQRGGAPCYRG